MVAVNVAFKFLDDDDVVPPGYRKVHGSHLIFDIKMEDFSNKSRYVAGGHTITSPTTLTYTSIVSRETVWIALTMAALNDLEVKASDMQNAYLTAPCSEKVWRKLLKRVPTPFENDYAPELDTMPVLDAAKANYYQSLVGVLR